MYIVYIYIYITTNGDGSEPVYIYIYKYITYTYIFPIIIPYLGGITIQSKPRCHMSSGQNPLLVVPFYWLVTRDVHQQMMRIAKK